MTDLPNTSLIPLTQGQFAIVDADIFEFLNQWKWLAQRKGQRFYAMRTTQKHEGKRRNIRMHMVINHASDNRITDHINGNGLDNRRCNLRSVTLSQNQWNAGSRGGSSKYKGVSWHTRDKAWRVKIKVDGNIISLGQYKTEEEAALAYNEGAIRLHGEYAKLNVCGY
jgi:hypothetical protein